MREDDDGDHEAHSMRQRARCTPRVRMVRNGRVCREWPSSALPRLASRHWHDGSRRQRESRRFTSTSCTGARATPPCRSPIGRSFSTSSSLGRHGSSMAISRHRFLSVRRSPTQSSSSTSPAPWPRGRGEAAVVIRRTTRARDGPGVPTDVQLDPAALDLVVPGRSPPVLPSALSEPIPGRTVVVLRRRRDVRRFLAGVTTAPGRDEGQTGFRALWHLA